LQHDYLCTLSRYNFSTDDYGTSTTFRLYDPDQAAFNATDYTGYVKITDSEGNEAVSEITPTWTTQDEGVGTFAFTSTNKIGEAGSYNVEVQLEKSGTVLSFKCINSIAVSRSP
jgi:hypothetical protein